MKWPYLSTILIMLLISSLSISVGLFWPSIASLKSVPSIPWYVACAVIFVFHTVIFVLVLCGMYKAQRR